MFHEPFVSEEHTVDLKVCYKQAYKNICILCQTPSTGLAVNFTPERTAQLNNLIGYQLN